MFEHSLVDLETKNQPRRRRWISLPIAVGLHVVGLTAFAFASYWSVGSVPEPCSLNVVFFDLAPLPPPAGGGHPKPLPRPERPQTPPQPTHPVQPTEASVPTNVPPPTFEDPPPTNDPSEGTDPTDPGVECPGCLPGPGVGPGPVGPGVSPVDAGPAADAPIPVTVGMTRPEILKRVQPRYTDIARKAGVQGSVIVEAIIDTQGRVTDARVLRGLPMGLDQEAVDAILQWRFKPAYQGSRPVKVYFTLTVNFTIQR
jgi:periplasmic protein TonB